MWYLHIARSGYFSRPATAFFPPYPLLLNVGGTLLGSQQSLWQCRARLPMAYFAYSLAALTQALSYPVAQDPMKSLSRYLLVIFPLFMAWGAYLGERDHSRRMMLGACGLGLVAFSGLWGTWAWIA